MSNVKDDIKRKSQNEETKKQKLDIKVEILFYSTTGFCPDFIVYKDGLIYYIVYCSGSSYDWHEVRYVVKDDEDIIYEKLDVESYNDYIQRISIIKDGTESDIKDALAAIEKFDKTLESLLDYKTRVYDLK